MLMKRETDVLVVQYPRGCTAVVWFDPVAGSINDESCGSARYASTRSPELGGKSCLAPRWARLLGCGV